MPCCAVAGASEVPCCAVAAGFRAAAVAAAAAGGAAAAAAAALAVSSCFAHFAATTADADDLSLHLLLGLPLLRSPPTLAAASASCVDAGTVLAAAPDSSSTSMMAPASADQLSGIFRA
eukprot:9465102-Alexandrium_andersonii.AAC.1